MSSDALPTEQRCTKQVSDRTGFHWWPCGKPAKFHVSNTGGKEYYVCGIHVQRVRRLIERGNATYVVRPLTALKESQS